MKNLMRLASFTLAASFALTACGKKPPPAEPAKAEPTKTTEATKAPEPATVEATKAPEPATVEATKAPEPATVEATKAPEPVPTPTTDGPKGRAATGNDAEALAKLAALEKCDITATYPENDCREALDPFVEATKIKADVPTLMNLAEDPAPWVRWATAVSLTRSSSHLAGPDRAADRERYLASVKAETDANVAKTSAVALMKARNEIDDPAFEAKLYDLATTHPLEEARAAMFNESFRGQVGVKFMLSRFDAEPSVVVRRAMVAGLYVIGEEHSAALCPWYAKLLADPDEEIQQKAAYNLIWSSVKCDAQYDALLTDLDARVKAGKLTFMYTLQVLYFIEDKTPATPEQKKRFLDLMRAAVAEKANAGMARSKALECLGKHDPDAKKFAADYLKDDVSFVAAEAKLITTGK